MWYRISGDERACSLWRVFPKEKYLFSMEVLEKISISILLYLQKEVMF